MTCCQNRRDSLGNWSSSGGVLLATGKSGPMSMRSWGSEAVGAEAEVADDEGAVEVAGVVVGVKNILLCQEPVMRANTSN